MEDKIMKTKIKELKEQAQELIDLGDSREKMEGYGMMIVIEEWESLIIASNICSLFYQLSSGIQTEAMLLCYRELINKKDKERFDKLIMKEIEYNKNK
jgi:hypothetical protein